MAKPFLSKALLCFAAAGSLLYFTGCNSNDEADPNELTRAPFRIVEVMVPPYLDGAIDEIAWKKAAMASAFMTQDGQWDLFSPRVYAVYDRSNLYFAWSCPLPAGTTAFAGLRAANDNNIREDESFEIFLDPFGKKKSYHHLIVNSLGYYYSSQRLQDGSIADWQVIPEIKTTKTANAWHAEVKIPLAALPPDCVKAYPGKWMVNFRRNRGGTGGVITGWSGTGSYNSTTQLMPAELSLRGGVSFAISPISKQLDRCDFELTVRNQALTFRKVLVCAGVSSMVAREYTLNPGEEAKMPVSVKIYQQEEMLNSRRGERMFVSCRDGIFNNLFDSRTGFLPSAEAELDSFFVYPGERILRFHVDSNFEKDNGKFATEIRQETGGAVKTFDNSVITADGSSSVQGKFNIEALEPGRYVAAVSAYNAKDNPFFTVFRPFIVKAEKYPPILPEGKIQWQPQGYLTIAGEPVFLFYLIPPLAPVPEISTSTFNVMYKQSQRQLDSLQPNCLERHGIVTTAFSLNGSVALEPAVLSKNIVDVAGSGAARLIFRNIGFNAGADLFSPEQNGQKIMPENYYRTIYDYLKKIDPHTPVGLHLAAAEYLPQFLDAADIFEVPVSYPSPGHIGKINLELQEIKKTAGVKPVIVCLNVNGVPPELIRQVAFIAMLRGAAGIVLNPGIQITPDEFSPQWRLYRGLASELSEAFPIIAHLQPEPEITITTGSDKLLWVAGRSKGRLYLLALNQSTAPVKMTAQSKLFTAKVKVLFEHREITANYAEFDDLLLPGEVRLFQVSK